MSVEMVFVIGLMQKRHHVLWKPPLWQSHRPITPSPSAVHCTKLDDACTPGTDCIHSQKHIARNQRTCIRFHASMAPLYPYKLAWQL